MGNLQSSPSTTTTEKKFDVFLNFRGEDTRDSFTSHLYEALHWKQIETFIDNQLIRGDEISSGLSTAIRESKISVVIFSNNYASSKWCLRELVEIMECKKMNNQIVIPVFYNVDPSDVRKQAGTFKSSFVKHDENELLAEVQKWREALIEASNLSGWDSFVTRPDTTLVDEIVNDIWKKLMNEYMSLPSDFGGLIGLERIEEVISLLSLHDRTDVRTIGIWGMGGIGKTTIADAIFSKNSNQFDGSCFIQNVREKLENCGGLDFMRKDILSKLLKDKTLELGSPTIPPIIKEKLNRKKVFIVLDDVDDFMQLETLAGGVDRLGQGSRVIITSRDKQVLRNCRVDDQNIYEVEGFNLHEALQLFCNSAFNQNHPTEDLRLLSIALVNYAKGNPLALKVLGLSLNQKSKQEWESAVDKLRTNFNRKIFDVLKISYDGLNDGEKDIFLHIACFLKEEDRDMVEKLLDNCAYSLSVLISKSLITISPFNAIQMHDLLQEMGREIVRKESPNKPGNRSRLWRHEDVLRTLMYDDGTDAVQAIVLDMSNMKDIHLSSQAFKKMKNLRFLTLGSLNYHGIFPYNSKVHFPNGLNYLSSDMKSLIWHGYPLKTLPSNFLPENLVNLNLSGSSLERLWEDTMHAPKLKWLILSGCQHLTKIPDLSESPLLDGIDLDDCRSLIDFPPLARHLKHFDFLCLLGCKSLRSFLSSIHFESLLSLDLHECNSLTKFPQISGNIALLDLSWTKIDEVPSSIQNLFKLQTLNLSNCKRLKHISTKICKLKSLCELNLENCSELERFPEMLDTMEHLEILKLSGAKIKELPHSIEHLNGIQKLFLRECKNLETLPSSICNLTSLVHLDLSDCSKLEILPENFGNLKSLKDLSADRTAIRQLPSTMMHLNELEKLSCRECGGLRFTHSSGLPCSLRSLCLSDCNMKEIPEDIGRLFSLIHLDLSRNHFESLPNSMKQLSKLKSLYLDNCNMLQSLMELPSNLEHLSARDCKQLRSLPDASEFAKFLFAQFTFTNCLNLKATAVSNMLETLKEGYTSFCYPGSEIPRWFSHQTYGSSIEFQMSWRNCFNDMLVAFVVCTVIAFKEYRFNGDHEDQLLVEYLYDHGCNDVAENSPNNIMVASGNGTSLIDSDHVALGYHDVSVHWLLEGREFLEEIEFTYHSFKFSLSKESPNCGVKYCGVYPIYAKNSDSDTDEEESGGSHEEEMESHPKRICC